MKDPKKYVGANYQNDKHIYPYCYHYDKGSLSIFGVTKTEEEAINQMKEILERYEQNSIH